VKHAEKIRAKNAGAFLNKLPVMDWKRDINTEFQASAMTKPSAAVHAVVICFFTSNANFFASMGVTLVDFPDF